MNNLLTVREVMDTDVPTLRPETEIHDAINLLLSKRVTGAPVISEAGEFVGILTEKACLKLIAKGAEPQITQGPVSKFMSTEVKTIQPDMDIYYAAGLFLQYDFRRFPVLEKGKLVGAITRFDILRAIESNRALVP
jgi:CBS domain-containing protein